MCVIMLAVIAVIVIVVIAYSFADVPIAAVAAFVQLVVVDHVVVVAAAA